MSNSIRYWSRRGMNMSSPKRLFTSKSDTSKKNYFSHIHYDGGRYQTQTALKYLSDVNFTIKDSSRILDAGCGDGALSLFLLQNHPTWEIEGFDLSDDQIKSAVSNFDKHSTNKNNYNFYVESFDSWNQYKMKHNVDIAIANFSINQCKCSF